VTSDLELLEAWRNGDKKAGSELFSRHFDSLYRFFASKVADDAEDLIQGTWMACVRYGDTVSKAASFRAYLFTVARNQLYRMLRNRQASGAAVDFTVSAIVDLAPSPATVAVAAQRDRDLLGALRSLPLESQLVLELHYWEDLSATELAEVLDMPVGTVKSRIRRAKQLLATALQRGKEATEDDALDDWVRSMRAKIYKRT